MKARFGFISNSSSASYIILVKGHTEEWLYQTIGSLLGFELEKTIYKEAEDDLKWAESQVKQYELDIKGKIYKPDGLFIDNLPHRIEVLKEIVSNKNKITFNGCISNSQFWTNWEETIGRDACRLKQVEVKSTIDGVEIIGTTSMHNNYTEGMPGIMKELALALGFGELGVEYELKIEKTG